MKYCTRCFYPNTKPDIWFRDDGVCAACVAFDEREKVDWSARGREFHALASEIRETPGYHCVVPVSGGKDSHAQVIRCLEAGFTVLAVNARTDDLSDLGRRNLNNIASLCDTVEVAVNDAARKKIARYGLETVGDISWAEHSAIFTIPFREALTREIPYIFWGENPQNEYGGPKLCQSTGELNPEWLQEFGGLNGLRVQDLLDSGVVEDWQLEQFRMPDLDGCNIKSLFVGYYYPWSGYDNAVLAKQYGFEWYIGAVEGVGHPYENLDNYQTGLHDYLKYVKFGYGRATDIVNNNIRRGRTSRELGREHILTWDGNYGANLSYLGKPASEVVGKLGLSTEELWGIIEQFTNKDLFEYVGGGQVKPLFLEDLHNA